jgi:hypothetical protein
MYPKTKSTLLEAIRDERGKLEAKINGMSPTELVYPGSMGEWSVKDILQHLVDWEQRWISWYEAGKRGVNVHTPAPEYNWRQMGELNEVFRQKHMNRPLADVLEDFKSSYIQIIDIVEEIPEAEMLSLNLYPWTGRLPLIAWISGNTCEHYCWAIQMIHPISIRRKIKVASE